MGLARLLTRAIKYEVTNTETGATELFTVNGAPPLAPDWSTPGYQGGMGIPGAWRAALLIADALGSVPWHAYRRVGEGPAVRLSPTPPLLDQPSPPETRVTTFSSLKSEEHTSELQSRENLVCRLLLEKKKMN